VCVCVCVCVCVAVQIHAVVCNLRDSPILVHVYACMKVHISVLQLSQVMSGVCHVTVALARAHLALGEIDEAEEVCTTLRSDVPCT